MQVDKEAVEIGASIIMWTVKIKFKKLKRINKAESMGSKVPENNQLKNK